MVPRHPARGPKLATDLRAHNRTIALRSAGEPLTPETDIYIADTLGELGLFFRLGDIAVMGGSFLPDIGGHNPLEAARLDPARRVRRPLRQLDRHLWRARRRRCAAVRTRPHLTAGPDPTADSRRRATARGSPGGREAGGRRRRPACWTACGRGWSRCCHEALDAPLVVRAPRRPAPGDADAVDGRCPGSGRA
jgi:hypothetical protein